jgi:hypothetical protein
VGDEVSACKTTTDGRAAMELPRRRWHLPHEAAILRLVGAVLIEAHDEWAIAERRYLSEGSMAAILAGGESPSSASSTPALLAS